MENFTNETLDVAQLPKFEEVQMTPLHPRYWRVVMLTWGLIFLVVLLAIVFGFLFSPDFRPVAPKLLVVVCASIIPIVALAYTAFRKKAFAFRTHDVLYRYGLLATTTVVIPYNRVQHVALHEGWLSRMFGLATVQVFTAGGSSSDIEIPGIDKTQAENIKQLLMGKIQKEL
ncbi:PH domain-containing protein [Flavobacterium caeni]|uniref:YdbS-like PH domain-containing protein n=1 Tax=Flavobacterium caeni TaxID=490189 RepID=A0A1G5BQS0_9FLAO|nr:PH domain-containing protein [Flavobacterium caeni]SCX92394.1 hypothetical protein SAMN02927903_00447 [Flavobacterium caeni]